MKKTAWLTILLLMCAYSVIGQKGVKKLDYSLKDLKIKANMVFLYYKDLQPAIRFYKDILGFKQVLDYGFAKAYRASSSSFVCLVDEKKGMHKTSEPRTVTLSFITDEIDELYKYLESRGVKMHSPLGNASRHPTRGFVALDPQGYYLEFETFLQHPQNKELHKVLKSSASFYPQKHETVLRPKNLGISGNVIWLYYRDISKAQKFYEENLGLKLLVDQGFAKVYASSSTCFIGLVDEAKGLHRFSSKKSVNIGFFTDELDGWYRYLMQKGLRMKDPLGNAEKGLVRAFVTYDSAGYYLEFDKFFAHKKNALLLKIIDEL